jgi:predicted lipid carrier protein YhbT
VDPLDSFFDALADRGHEAVLEGESATMRFDVAEGETSQRWYVTVTNGDVSVSHRRIRADAIVRADRVALTAVVSGRSNAMAAMLRGLLVVEGDWAPLAMFQRILPGPPDSKGRVAPIPRELVMAQRRTT